MSTRLKSELFSVNLPIIKANPITEELRLPEIIGGELRSQDIDSELHDKLRSNNAPLSTSLVKLLSAANSSYRFRGAIPVQSVTKHLISSIEKLRDISQANFDSLFPHLAFLERCELPLLVHDLSETIVEPSSNGQMLEGLDIDDKNAFEQKLFKQLVRASFQKDFFQNIQDLRQRIQENPLEVQRILFDFLEKKYLLKKDETEAADILY
ncbi:MAG: hypothetical protein LW817_01605, partial [Candidatus Caenarcaniphilales bacterium]|nr:hypothetical protein [Candidatus Caenarcaniphilales bacterium]